MSISMSRYVRIISSVTGASAVAQQQLIGRRFTDHPRVPVGKIVSVLPGGAEDYFGADSEEARFAREYFSYISPAPASQARELQFAAWPVTSRPARVYGFKAGTTLTEFKGVTSGVLDGSLDGVLFTTGPVDLSEATSLTNVAELVTLALPNEASDITITYKPLEGVFEATTLIADASVTLTFGPQSLGALLGLSGPRAIESPGSAAQSPLEAFRAAEDVTDSFGSSSFSPPVDLNQALDLAAYVSGANVKYQHYWSVSPDQAEAWSAAMVDLASNGLILNDTPNESKEALPMAVMAATEYQRTNSAINYMFRQSGAGYTPDVTTDAMANFYDNLRVNYYGQTATAGQKISFFQQGNLCGGATAPLDMGVHANEQDLKAFLTSQLMSLHLTVNKIPANLDGRAMVMAIVNSGVVRALNNGTILPGKTLTELQKVAIIRGTNDPLAWHDIQTNGYWYDAQIVQETGQNGVTVYVAQYTLFYAKGDSVRRIEGSHNLV